MQEKKTAKKEEPTHSFVRASLKVGHYTKLGVLVGPSRLRVNKHAGATGVWIF